MNNFTFQYPLWFIGFCVLAGIAYAFILYYRENKLVDHALWKRLSLALLRFLSVFGISLLLLGPLLKLTSEEIKNPTVVVIQDSSSSISEEDVNSTLNKLKDDLVESFEVDFYNFNSDISEGLTDTFTGSATNLSRVFSFLDETYANQNLGAVVMATDGIYNEGQNPVYQNTNLTAPMYFIAQGDTTRKKDILIKQLYHNKIAYLGDKFIVQADVQSYNFVNTNTSIALYKLSDQNRRLVDKKPIQISDNSFFSTYSFEVPADQVGIVKYELVVEPRAGEFSTSNNRNQFYIDILDARQKILILANSPHPDIAALKNIITSNKNYEVESQVLKNENPNLAAYDLVIFHNLPSQAKSINTQIDYLNSVRKPRMFIAGSQISNSAFNKVQNLINLRANTESTNEVQADVNKSFKIFEQSDELKQNIESFPPLISKFGEYTPDPNTSVILNQKIGDVSTDYPLLAMRNQSGIREAVLTGEGIWQWRLYNYLQNKNFDLINELVTKTVQFVTIKEDKRKFRVSSAANIYKTYDQVGFDAELYNESYEKVNEVDAFLTIVNDNGQEYNYTFSKIADFYQIDAGTLPAGNYSFTGRTNYNGTALTSSGKFSVQEVQLEMANTTANHALLQSLTDKYGGEVLYNEKTLTLGESLKNNDQLKPIIYSSMKTESALNLKWILFLLIGLLFAEWFFRRLLGTY